MQNSLDLNRFKTVDLKKLAALGCDVQGTKVLCAASEKALRLTTGVLPQPMICVQNNEKKIVQRFWYPVTKTEAVKLQRSFDPYGKPNVRFAYVPVPAIPEQNLQGIEEVDLVGAHDMGKGMVAVAPKKKEEPKKVAFADDLPPVEGSGVTVASSETAAPAAADGEGQEAAGAVASGDGAEGFGEDEAGEAAAGDELEGEPADPYEKAVKKERGDLEKLTVAQLKEQVKDLGFEVPKNAKKDELIEMIVG